LIYVHLLRSIPWLSVAVVGKRTALTLTELPDGAATSVGSLGKHAEVWLAVDLFDRWMDPHIHHEGRVDKREGLG
jgi:hypothetical protein